MNKPATRHGGSRLLLLLLRLLLALHEPDAASSLKRGIAASLSSLS